MKIYLLVFIFCLFCIVSGVKDLYSENLSDKIDHIKDQEVGNKELFLQNDKKTGCNCHVSQECFLNEYGFPDCKCSDNKIENEAYGFKYCLDCNCLQTQECFINEEGLADCRCASGKIEKNINSVKTCIDCDCADGICILDENNVKKCQCGLKQVKGNDGKCYDCDCGLGLCNLNSSNAKSCNCEAGQAIGTDGKCYECDCGIYGLCKLDGNGKKCTCAPNTVELNGYCTECNCGPHGLCSFESGRKKCVCSPYSIERNGNCIVIETKTTVTADSSSLITAILTSPTPDCYCGENAKSCYFNFKGDKICNCLSGFSQLHGFCKECNCGPYGSCSFESDVKKCTCEPFSIEENGICIVILSTTSESTNKSIITSSTILPTSRDDCYCGDNSRSCHFNLKGDKICDCFPGYSEDNGYCYECDCGSRGTCTFEFMQKKCICSAYTSVKNEKCVDCNCGINSQLCFFRRDGTKVCNCNFGYTQVNGYCSAICNNDKCVNGKCEISGKDYKCRCNEGFSGTRCEETIETKSYTPDTWQIIQVSLLFVIFLLIFGVLCCLVRSKR